MVHDAGPLGFRAIYDRAGMPARLFQTFKAAVETYQELAGNHGHLEPARFQERMIERFLTLKPFAPREDILYLFERLDRDRRGQKWADAQDLAAQSKRAA
jgi:uncharacterized protein (DUF2336 family)